MALNIYLDIDGVLLTTKTVRLDENATKLIHFLVKNFDCFWLSTHCKGDASTAVRYLQAYFTKEDLPLLKKIKATNWETLKTEGIDFKSDFIWLDDYVLQSERNILEQMNCISKLKIVDLKRENEINNIISFCKSMQNTCL